VSQRALVQAECRALRPTARRVRTVGDVGCDRARPLPSARVAPLPLDSSREVDVGEVAGSSAGGTRRWVGRAGRGPQQRRRHRRRGTGYARGRTSGPDIGVAADGPALAAPVQVERHGRGRSPPLRRPIGGRGRVRPTVAAEPGVPASRLRSSRSGWRASRSPHSSGAIAPNGRQHREIYGIDHSGDMAQAGGFRLVPPASVKGDGRPWCATLLSRRWVVP
jgi:hypothetical protein